jgi:hypothetical protein
MKPKRPEGGYRVRERLEACDAGVSAYGMRYEEMKLRIWDAVVRRRLDAGSAHDEFKMWLLTGRHVSRDLEADRKGTTRRMLRDAKGLIASAIRWRERQPYLSRQDTGSSHRRRKVKGSNHPSTPALPSLFSHILQVQEHQRRGPMWRTVMLANLTGEDREALGRVQRRPTEWFRSKLAVLLGTLRAVRERDPNANVVSISRAGAKRISGGRQPSWLKPHRVSLSSDRRRVKPAAYRVMLREAASQGWLRFQDAERRGYHGTVFRFWLPGDDGPPLKPDTDDLCG